MTIVESAIEGFGDVLDHLGQTEGAQRPERQAAHHGIVVVAVFGEGVGAHLCQLGVGSGVVAEKEVDHFLDDEVTRLDDEHHFGEEAGDVDS